MTDIYVLPEVLLEHRVTATQYSSVCVQSEQRFQRRQEAFDRVHKLLMHNITDKCYSQDMKIYTGLWNLHYIVNRLTMQLKEQ